MNLTEILPSTKKGKAEFEWLPESDNKRKVHFEGFIKFVQMVSQTWKIKVKISIKSGYKNIN